MDKKHSDIVSSHYLPRLKKYEENHKVLDWESRDAHSLRFSALADSLNLNGLSLLDVGCGMGDLYTFLQQKHVKVKYTGADLLPEMVERAKKTLPKVHFIVADAFDQDCFEAKSFDVIYCAGVFNLVMGDNMAFLRKGIEVFAKTARRYVVISLLDDRSKSPEKEYYYFNKDKLQDMIRKMGFACKILDGYLNNDMTVILELES